MPDLNPMHWFHKDDRQRQREEVSLAIPVLASDSARTPSDIETQQQLGINIHMIESDELMNNLTKLAERHYKIPLMQEVPMVTKEGVCVIDANGEQVYNKQPINDKEGNPIFEERVFYHPVFFTLKVHLDKLFSTRYLDPIDADIAIHQVKYDFNELKMQLSYEEFSQWNGYIDALQRMAISAICDSKKGRKAQLMKITSKTYEMRLRSMEEGKKGMGLE